MLVNFGIVPTNTLLEIIEKVAESYNANLSVISREIQENADYVYEIVETYSAECNGWAIKNRTTGTTVLSLVDVQEYSNVF